MTRTIDGDGAGGTVMGVGGMSFVGHRRWWWATPSGITARRTLPLQPSEIPPKFPLSITHPLSLVAHTSPFLSLLFENRLADPRHASS